MKECGYEENGGRCLKARETASKQRFVKVSERPFMNRYIPVLPEVLNRFGIPPITIEFTITKFTDFSPKVERRMEERIEKDEPNNVIGYLQSERERENGKLTVQVQNGQINRTYSDLQKAFEHSWIIHLLKWHQRIVDGGYDPLLNKCQVQLY